MKITIELDRIAVAGTPESNLLMRLAGMALPGDADASEHVREGLRQLNAPVGESDYDRENARSQQAAADAEDKATIAAGPKRAGRPAKAASAPTPEAPPTAPAATAVQPAAAVAPAAPSAAANVMPYPVDGAALRVWMLSLTKHGKTKEEIIGAFKNAGTGVANPIDVPLPSIPGVVDHVRKVLSLSAAVV